MNAMAPPLGDRSDDTDDHDVQQLHRWSMSPAPGPASGNDRKGQTSGDRRCERVISERGRIVPRRS